MKKRKTWIIVGVLLVLLVVLVGAGLTYHEQPRFCADLCHIMGPYLGSWQESDYGAAAHAAAGVACLDCHEPTIQEQVNELLVFVRGDFTTPLQELEVSDEFCYDCHMDNEHEESDQVVQRTADREQNPHDSHLIGELGCSTCHKMHKPSEDYCAECHGAVATGAGWTAEVTRTAEIQVWDPDMDCTTCKSMVPYVDSTADNALMAYAHAEEGAVCLDCHEQESTRRVHEEADVSGTISESGVGDEFCTGCHLDNEHASQEQVVARTSERDVNPHDSHLIGEMGCSTCHKVHKPSEDHCAECHGAVATGAGWTTEVTRKADVQLWDPDMDCTVCKSMVPYVDSLEGSDLSAKAHAAEGLVCVDCHEQTALETVHIDARPGDRIRDLNVADEFCLGCHVENEHSSDEEVIESTKDSVIFDKQINPHDQHPEGLLSETQEAKIVCARCHQTHEKSPLLEGCYGGCHHKGTRFERCVECHTDW